MKKRILITGASGFIGSFLVEEGIQRGYRTIAGVRNTSSRQYLKDPEIHFLEMNFSNDRSLDITLQGFANEFGMFDFIVHTAGITKAKDKADYYSVNFENTKRFVRALIRNGMIPGKFVYLSSLASLGPGEDASPITPDQEKRPLTAYGISKLKAEQFISETPDFPFLIINSTAVYGPRGEDFLFLVKTIERHLEVYIRTTSQLLSFVHVRDLCEAVFLSMESEAVNQRLLVSDLKVYTSKMFNQIVKSSLNRKTFSFIVPSTLARGFAFFSEILGNITGGVPILNRERLKEFEALNWSVDCSEIVKLGFVPQFSLEQGLKNTIQWYKVQRNRK